VPIVDAAPRMSVPQRGGRDGRPAREARNPRDRRDARKEQAPPSPAEASLAATVSLAAIPQDALLARLKSRERDVLVALDHVQDPRNLGAIARSAAFFGVTELIAPERRQVLLTQAGVATAQGAFALVDLVAVVNLARTLTQLKELGYWIIGTEMGGEPLSSVAGQYAKTVVVLGAEDTGMSRQIRELCDRHVAIARRGRGLDSLNVSVAAGIVLEALTR
jgi:23S rRNA (guanosine2251-2'-O)-methyltransferase